MQMITTIGFDIAKSVFQVHGVDAAGEVVIRRQLKRRYVLAFFQKLPSCLVGIEACASSHLITSVSGILPERAFEVLSDADVVHHQTGGLVPEYPVHAGYGLHQ